MGDAGELRARQLAFAAHLRDPQQFPAPGDVEDRRMAIYRALIFNNVSSLLGGSFPVLHRLLEGAPWDALIRDFFVRHRCRTPLFMELPEEFLGYLEDERAESPDDPPFLLELAHYEWIELALQVSDRAADLANIDPNGDLMAGVPVISPLARNLSYRFPVHRIGPDFRPGEPPDAATHLAVYRTRADDIEFLEINAPTQRLLQLLQASPTTTGLAALRQIATELNHPQPEQVVAFGAQQLDQLHARGVILGTRLPAVLKDQLAV